MAAISAVRAFGTVWVRCNSFHDSGLRHQSTVFFGGRQIEAEEPVVITALANGQQQVSSGHNASAVEHLADKGAHPQPPLVFKGLEAAKVAP